MQAIKYMTSQLTFYLKGEIAQEQNFINLKRPNTILGFIPLGAQKESIPVSQLSSVESNFKLHLKRFLVGLIISILGLALISGSFVVGLLILAVGANYVITAFETTLTIKTTCCPFCNEKNLLNYLIFFLTYAKIKAENLYREVDKSCRKQE